MLPCRSFPGVGRERGEASRGGIRGLSISGVWPCVFALVQVFTLLSIRYDSVDCKARPETSPPQGQRQPATAEWQASVKICHRSL